MALTLRIPKGEKLTIQEADNNFTYLENLAESKLSTSSFTEYSQSVDTRIDNIVIGTGFATTGSNTFTGDQTISGSLNINGPISQTGLSNFSTIIGSGAGTPTGTVNTLIGFQAGKDLAGGIRNTYLGAGAGSATTEGVSNTFIGQSAGSNNIIGSSNIVIGRSAGNTLADGTTPVTALGESIFIGNFTKSGNDNIFNQIVIGTNAIGEGENTVTIGNNNIVSTHLKGTVHITNTAILPAVSASLNFADDTAAGVGGVPLGGLYRNGNVIQIRLT